MTIPALWFWFNLLISAFTLNLLFLAAQCSGLDLLDIHITFTLRLLHCKFTFILKLCFLLAQWFRFTPQFPLLMSESDKNRYRLGGQTNRSSSSSPSLSSASISSSVSRYPTQKWSNLEFCQEEKREMYKDREGKGIVLKQPPDKGW